MIDELLHQYMLMNLFPNVIDTNNDEKFDVDLSKLNTRIDDSNLFDIKEKSSFDNLNFLLSSKVELKSQNKSKNYIWLEYEIEINGVIKPSGLSTTQSEIYRISIFEIVLEFKTDYLKWLVNKRKELNINESRNNNIKNYIGIGINVPFAELLNYQKLYHQSQEYRKLRLKALKNSN